MKQPTIITLEHDEKNSTHAFALEHRYRMRSSEDVGANWQDRAYHVMKNYSWKVNGSTIHRERWQVRWDYRGCNLEWASTQVPHLIERLEDELPVLLTTRLQVLRLAEQISVLPRWVRKVYTRSFTCIISLTHYITRYTGT